LAYEAGRRRWRLAVVEPNICMVKTCHIPMLACDGAHRRDATFIEVMRVYNSLHLKERPDFVALAMGLDLVRHGIATFEGRFPIYEILGAQAEAIVSHSWENEQNYVYYEALYGGFPLIHNSGYLGGCGYRYETFDPESGGQAIARAFAEHDERLADYRKDARAFLATLDPTSESNVASYGRAIVQLFETP
jgi:hypothetical protein